MAAVVPMAATMLGDITSPQASDPFTGAHCRLGGSESRARVSMGGVLDTAGDYRRSLPYSRHQGAGFPVHIPILRTDAATGNASTHQEADSSV